MTTIISVIVCIILLQGCTKTLENETDNETSDSKVLLLGSSADKSQGIKDLNIYVFRTTTSVCAKHYYSTDNKKIEMVLPIGQYEILAYANAGKDLGDNMSITDVQQLKYQLTTISDNYLPMFGSTSILLGDNISKEITLNNCTARVAFNVKVSDKIDNIIIQKITLKNVSLSGYFNSPETKAENLCDIPFEMQPGRNYSDTVFIAENCAGTNSLITVQRDKNQQNAPDNASFIQINALSGNNKFLTYSVFLGENNTTDFNVRRNSSHILNITIEGEDKIDTRMESDTIEVSDNMLSRCPYHSTYPFPADNYSINFKKVSSGKRYTANIMLIDGDNNYFTINEQQQFANLDLGNLNIDETFQIGYNPPLVSATNCVMCYRVTLKSSDGNVYQEDFSRTFANLLKIRYDKKLGNLDKNYGAGYKYYKDDTIIISVPDSIITLKAECVDGCALDGWYRENGQIITQNELYIHRLSTKNEILTMNFKREKVYIYTNLDEVELRCLKKDPIIDYEKNAYVVDVNEYCEIRGKDLSKLIDGWYDEKGTLISSEPDLNITATENIHIYPRYK